MTQPCPPLAIINTKEFVNTLFGRCEKYICLHCQTQTISTEIWHEEDCNGWPQCITDLSGNFVEKWFKGENNKKIGGVLGLVTWLKENNLKIGDMGDLEENR